jgi:quercetin dioxygenase-like cupin family protein
MRVFELEGREIEPVDPTNFTGEGTLVRMAGVASDPEVHAYRVTFEPRTRTAWHTHSGPQILVVVEGTCRLQKKGESTREVGPGGLVSIEPGELHWHGASPAGRMVHVALNIGAQTTWLEKVSDAEYDAR